LKFTPLTGVSRSYQEDEDEDDDDDDDVIVMFSEEEEELCILVEFKNSRETHTKRCAALARSPVSWSVHTNLRVI